MEAAHNGNYNSVDILLARGAFPDMQDDVSLHNVNHGHLWKLITLHKIIHICIVDWLVSTDGCSI